MTVDEVEATLAWARGLDTTHEHVWVDHPTADEQREAYERLVDYRPWYWPFKKKTKIVHLALNIYFQHYRACEICDERENLGPSASPAPVEEGWPERRFERAHGASIRSWC